MWGKARSLYLWLRAKDYTLFFTSLLDRLLLVRELFELHVWTCCWSEINWHWHSCFDSLILSSSSAVSWTFLSFFFFSPLARYHRTPQHSSKLSCRRVEGKKRDVWRRKWRNWWARGAKWMAKKWAKKYKERKMLNVSGRVFLNTSDKSFIISLENQSVAIIISALRLERAFLFLSNFIVDTIFPEVWREHRRSIDQSHTKKNLSTLISIWK